MVNETSPADAGTSHTLELESGALRSEPPGMGSNSKQRNHEMDIL